MSDDATISLEALEREESRLRERLAKIALVKSLLTELALPPSTPAQSYPAQSENAGTLAAGPAAGAISSLGTENLYPVLAVVRNCPVLDAIDHREEGLVRCPCCT